MVQKTIDLRKLHGDDIKLSQFLSVDETLESRGIYTESNLFLSHMHYTSIEGIFGEIQSNGIRRYDSLKMENQ